MSLHDFLRDEHVLHHFETAKATLLQSIQLQFGPECDTASIRGGGPIESPIEAIFVIWWEALTHAADTYRALQLRPQTRVELQSATYRLDFSTVTIDAALLAIARHVGFPPPLIAIELDGHDFHEKTKEQVTARNQRDRDLQAAGWKVLHVSGSELARQPAAAVGDVLAAVDDTFAEFRVAVMNVFTDKR